MVVAKFHKVIRSDGHACSVVLVVAVYELVVCASFDDVGLESLEGGFLVHGEMCWMQRKERGGSATKWYAQVEWTR